MELYGERKRVSPEEYIAARQQTGLDIDGRQELVQRMNEVADLLAKQLINFAKAIPGENSNIDFEVHFICQV